MKKIINKLLNLFLFLFFSITPINLIAQETEKQQIEDQVIPREITIGFLEFRPLYYMEDGEIVGFYAELMERTLNDLNIQYRIVYKEGLPDIWDELVSGDIDLLSGVLRTPEREHLFYWPQNQLRNYYSTLFSLHENTFESPEELRGRKIGFIENEATGTLFEDLMEDLNINYETRYYPNVSSLIKAVKNEDIYAFVSSSGVQLSQEDDSEIHQSNFIFSPLNAYVVTSIQNDAYAKQVVEMVSERIYELKNDRSSYFYDLYAKYYEELVIEETPLWITTVLFIFVLTTFFSLLIIKVLNTKIMRSNSELKELNDTLEERIEAAAKEMAIVENLASVGRLTASIAHEINTPIGVAYTSSGLEQKRLEDIKQKYEEEKLTEEDLLNFFDSSKDALGLLSFNLQKAAELIADLKRLSSDQVNTNDIKDYELPYYIEKIWESIKLNYKDKDIKLDLDCDNILIKNDIPSRAYQIFSNLIVNSFEHGFSSVSKGTIYITIKVLLDEKGNKLYFCYEDDGVGISDDIVDKVWEPFFTTKRTEGHTGLGLSTIWNILKIRNVEDLILKNRVGGGFHLCYKQNIEESTLTKENKKFIINI